MKFLSAIFSGVVILLSTVIGLQAAEPVRIMAVGDSLTENSPGYKEFLYFSLKQNGYLADFVGPQKGTASDGGQLDHAGHGGFTIGPGPSKGDEWTGGKGNIYVNVEEYLHSKPDVILLMIGTNEYFNIGKLQPDLDPDRDSPGRLKALVEHIRDLDPKVKIFVASVPPVAWNKDFAKGINTALPDLLKGKENVVFVDMAKKVGFVPGDWSPDNLHPSISGYKKIADVWYSALIENLPKPDPALVAAAAENQAKAEAAKAEEAKKKQEAASAIANRIRGPITPVWDFTQQKPSYGYVSWDPLDKSGEQKSDGWKINAVPDGGLGIVLPSTLNLTGYLHLLLQIKKDDGGTADLFVKLICEQGDLTFNVPAASLGSDMTEVVLVLANPSSGNGDLSSVKQVQIQGNFNKGQKMAYTVKSLEAEKAPESPKAAP